MATAIFSFRNTNSGEEEERFEYFHYRFIIHQICVWSYSNALGSPRRCYRMSASADQGPRLSLALFEPTLEVTVAELFFEDIPSGLATLNLASTQLERKLAVWDIIYTTSYDNV
jgi:hypothetical protein